MVKYKIILFDLDGTLSDPKIGITKSVQYALQKMGIIETDLNKLVCFIGPPLQTSFAENYNFNIENTKIAIDFYRERFKEKGMFENNLYPSIPTLLKSLKELGFTLVVATSKPTVFSEQILNYFNIDEYFDLVVGSNLDGTRAAKTEIIQYILDQYDEHELEDFIMIGDREHDIIGANNNGIDSIGVAYGYGTSQELSHSNPTYMVKSVEQLKEILMEPSKKEITNF
ncbi:HAD family hydrolase [Paenisporosarcina quisquiliarum]|uniref:HAD family hydrolase n=1 Tax=Paenisporosarcina quisquiliarum TaxID=365346 RepID=A0A9X3LGQ2_9BACL|nr:HAD family hydrolase [Paenisporosarcina quisquiliarum]MCZ8537085.1 HAD family hydrolase [Paenisporosarcina quisquiliarum]